MLVYFGAVSPGRFELLVTSFDKRQVVAQIWICIDGWMPETLATNESRLSESVWQFVHYAIVFDWDY
jgi:hypothetical protein